MLTLPIKKIWYDKIISGEKKEEYREMKDYYHTRLSPYGYEVPFFIRLRAGYRKDSPVLECKVLLRVGTGRNEWGAEPGTKYYVLQIEEVKPVVNTADNKFVE